MARTAIERHRKWDLWKNVVVGISTFSDGNALIDDLDLKRYELFPSENRGIDWLLKNCLLVYRILLAKIDCDI
jgi:hypothetical protein